MNNLLNIIQKVSWLALNSKVVLSITNPVLILSAQIPTKIVENRQVLILYAEDVTCFSKRAIVHLSHIFDSILHLFYFPPIWKSSTILFWLSLKSPKY